MAWVLIFQHKVWNCCPERYGQFQREIPSTSGAICEKPQGALSPPPSGARVNTYNKFKIVRGVFNKFAAQPRRKTNFTTKRGGRDVTLLKRFLAQPLANRSCCFAQAVGCCKNVCYFCRTQRRSAGSSDSIRGVTEKRRKGYPWGPVGNTGGILSSLQEGQSDDWALQSWSTEHWRWPPQRSSTSSSVWRKRGRSESSSNEWTSMSVRNLTAEVRIYDAYAETIIFWHINTLCVHLKTDAQMPNSEQGQICTETSSGVLIRPRRFAYSIFAPVRNTGSSLGPWEQERVAPVEPLCATIAQEEKVVKSAGKVMVTVFSDTERLLRVDFLDYGIYMNWEYYNSLLKRRRATNIEKRHSEMPKDVRLLG